MLLCGERYGDANLEQKADTGAIMSWLLPRRACMEAVTFKKFAVSGVALPDRVKHRQRG